MRQFKCPLDKIHVNQMFNCRFEITPSSCRGLAESIKKHGLLQPVIVRRATKQDGVKATYVLLAGFRRYIAFKYLLKRDSIPAKLVTPVNREDSEEINFTENLIRENLSISEEAVVVDKLLRTNVSILEIARRLNRSKDWVAIRRDFLLLPDEVKMMVESGNLSLKEVKKLIRFYKNKPDTVITSEAKKILKRRADRVKELTSEEDNKLKDRKKRTSELVTYLLQRDSSDALKHVIAALMWVQGEVVTSHLFDLIGLSSDEALEYDLTVEGKK